MCCENVEWMWVSSPTATFVLEVHEGRVVSGAPYGMAIVRKLGIRDAQILWRYFAAIEGSRLEWL